MNIDTVMSILVDEVKSYKVPVVDLIQIQTKDPFKVLVSTILSARTKDEVTSKASERLFNQVSNVKQLSKLAIVDIEKLIYPVGFYKTKAIHLKNLYSVMGDKVPDTIEKLLKLPGVGRKTANLVLAVAFGIPAICVDTHVHRITNRWGYVKTKNPLETEMTLRKKLPINHWLVINTTLVAFGQNLCRPIGPKCKKCPIIENCAQFNLK